MLGLLGFAIAIRPAGAWKMQVDRAYWLLVCAALSLSSSAAQGEDAIPAKTLDVLKDATVYIKTETAKGGKWGTGSGFLVKVNGNTGHIITNDHVVNTPSRLGRPTWTVVFRSGSNRERTVPAQVLCGNINRDLALLAVANVPDLPEPIDVSRQAELIETLPVFISGFPLGERLTGGKVKLSATISKGAISSVRRDDRDEIDAIQIEGSLNPGNSGGPVVDSQGRLVGVVTSGFVGTQIGLAIPPSDVSNLFNGKLFEPFEVVTKGVGNAQVTVTVNAGLHDRLSRMKSASVWVIGAEMVKKRPAPDKNGEWAALPGALEYPLTLEKERATGEVPLNPSPDKSVQAKFYLQASHVDADGTAHFTSPGVYTINLKSAGAVALAPPKPEPGNSLIGHHNLDEEDLPGPPHGAPAGGVGAVPPGRAIGGGQPVFNMPAEDERPLTSVKRARKRIEEKRKRTEELRDRLRRQKGAR